MDRFDAVEEKYRQEALRKLKKRIAAGEKPEDILQVSDKFYLDKLVSGVMPISYNIYDRIMGCTDEDSPDAEEM